MSDDAEDEMKVLRWKLKDAEEALARCREMLGHRQEIAPVIGASASLLTSPFVQVAPLRERMQIPSFPTVLRAVVQLEFAPTSGGRWSYAHFDFYRGDIEPLNSAAALVLAIVNPPGK